MRGIAALGILLLAIPAAAADQPSMTQQQRTAAIRQLHWLDAGNYQLPLSHSTLALPQGYRMVLGEDARRLMQLTGDQAKASVEAVALSPNFKDEIIFQGVNDGYVRLDDWSEVDAAAMIRQIRENTEKENEWRRQQGFDEIHVVGWLRQPTLDRATSTAFWAIEGSNGQGGIVNSIALRLGRNGYERLNWIVDKRNYVAGGGQLDLMLRAHSYDAGYRYADHASGDKVAAYTIAGLVAAVAGAKLLKVAAGVGLLVLLKKFGAIIVALGAAVLYRVRRFFRRQPASGPNS
jgi:uncharacterized membrane-anchored protein